MYNNILVFIINFEKMKLFLNILIYIFIYYNLLFFIFFYTVFNKLVINF